MVPALTTRSKVGGPLVEGILDINGRVALVTGAASGFGGAVSQMVVDRGGKVLLLDTNEAAVSAAASRLGDAAAFFCGDVTSEADGQAAVDEALRHFGRLDILTNCAGVAPGARVLGRNGPHSLEAFQRTVTINLVGTFNMLRLAAEVMSRQEPDSSTGERGLIVNTASIAAYDGQVGQAAYSASKAGVAAITLPVARELAAHGIRVMTIAPGIFETPMMAAMPRETQDALGASVPFPPRMGRPQEFAALVEHIAGNVMLNGEVIRLDGALRMVDIMTDNDPVVIVGAARTAMVAFRAR